MQPFVAADHVKSAYRRYIRTSFPIRRREVEERFLRLVDHERLLWQDPFISLARPFAEGKKFAELVSERLIGEDTAKVRWGIPDMRAHQVATLRRLSSFGQTPRSTIVATGTGSGKTESFLVPIVDDCLRNPKPEGVRALILYPMNALANDQLKRLRVVLAGSGVTFGRYTGDTPRTEQDALERGKHARPKESPREERYYRKEIQDSPPQILLTNYTMLELLLLRKREQQIFRGGAPRYLVLDEVHTYTGILGAEVACLLRRFKEHVGCRPGELTCVGTSATVKSNDSAKPEEELTKLLGFARDLFAEEFDGNAVVEEKYDPPRSPGTARFGPCPTLSAQDVVGFDPDDPSAVAALYGKWAGESLSFDDERAYEELFRRTADRREFLELEQALLTPKPLSQVEQIVRGWPARDPLDHEKCRAEATTLFLLGCAARTPGTGSDGDPRFRPKVHLQMRSMTSLNTCLRCEDLLADGRTECTASVHPEIGRTLVLGVCRSCGQDYLLGRFLPPALRHSRAGEEKRLEIEDLDRRPLSPSESDGEELETLYLLPAEASPFLPGKEPDGAPSTAGRAVCPCCLDSYPLEADAPIRACTNEECAGKGRVLPRRFVAFLRGARCPICLAQGRGRRPQVITPLRSGAASSVSVITQSLFPYLEKDERRKLDEKRVLIFADSRQDTAHQAGYLRDRHQVFTQRQLVYRTLTKLASDGKAVVPLAERGGRAVLANEVFLWSRARFGEHVAMDLLTPVSVRGDDLGFFNPDKVVTKADVDQAVERLRWDLALEFTDRATGRYSLEREGLTKVEYAGLSETADQFGATLSSPPRAVLATLLRAILDAMRYEKAVDYEPFRDFLGFSSDAVRRGIARPTKQTKTPVGFDSAKRSRQGGYDVKAWYHAEKPGAHRTTVYDFCARALPEGTQPEKVTAFIDGAVALLEKRGHIRRVEIGARSSGKSGVRTTAFQVNEKHVEVGVGGDRFRCDACGRVMAYKLPSSSGSAGMCTSYRCRGSVVKIEKLDFENFYVRLYAKEEPERLYPVEHSGQLSNDERVQVEQKFREGAINALVCTPTLELGVDIGDLVALVMRNVPPTPSNYSQRAGRAGRRKKIGLILSHAGQGAHDSYFFEHPEEMIVGAIRPPTVQIDNRVVLDRHVNSLILEKLAATVPEDWRVIRTDDGRLRDETLDPFRAEVQDRLGDIQAAVASAFVRDRAEGGLGWLDENYVRGRIDAFVDGLRRGLDHWCVRYREIYEELRKSRSVVVPSAYERERERKLAISLQTLENDQRYYPLSYLAQVGFLPRYGFPGAMVTVRDSREREISQGASVGITEFAPGNIVYVAGEKIRVERIVFPGGAKEDPRQNAETYRYCPTCSFVTANGFAVECPYCRTTLSCGRYIRFEAVRGSDWDVIGQEDEYRERGAYEVVEYLRHEAAPTGEIVREAEGWTFRYSRLRQVEIYNRGMRKRGGAIEPFRVCLECGVYRSGDDDPDEDQKRERGTGHLRNCTRSTWNPDEDDRIERALHLQASFQGDVVQVDLGSVVSNDDAWVRSFERALLVGLQLELFVDPREVGAFLRNWTQGTTGRRELVFYDTMPGGTGYLKKLVEELPRIAHRALTHLLACPCQSACYRCLKDFWNQRHHDVLDKRLVVAALRTIAAATGAATPTADVEIDTRFESFLEMRFYKELEKAGLPLPKVQPIIRSADGRYIVRADFRYEDPPLVILTDGRAFHARTEEQILEDIEKRNALEFAGRRLLEFSYSDVVEAPETLIETVRRALGLGPAVSPVGATDGADLGAAERLLANRLAAEVTGLRPGVVLSLPPGQPLVTLAADPDRRRAVIAINPKTWVADASTWCEELRQHTALRIAGWRVFRLAVPVVSAQSATALVAKLRGLP